MRAQRLPRRAPESGSDAQIQRRLALFNQKRLRPAFAAGGDWSADLAEEIEARGLEARFVEAERARLAPQLDAVPRESAAFLRWFEDLKRTGPGQGDALFPWLARDADLEHLRWFLAQEVAGEAGFDDLLAMTLVRFPLGPKLEMARNFWDEMGRGHAGGVHGVLLMRVTEDLDLRPKLEDTVWESLALANLMVALAANRRYAYQAVGALGAIEMTAPGRVAQVNAGMKRLGLAAPTRAYFQLHAGLDVEHSAAWNREVIGPLVAAEPRAARAIAEGALLRLAAGARCFARYRAELGVETEAKTEDDAVAA